MITQEQIAFADQRIRKLLDRNVRQQQDLRASEKRAIERSAWAECSRLDNTLNGLLMAESALQEELRELRMMSKYIVDIGFTEPAQAALT